MMRWLVGVVLISAAMLKSVQLLTEPSMAIAAGRWLLSAQIGLEVGVGVMAFTGAYWSKVRWAALLIFTSFASYTLFLALGGAASCGCFGPLEVHPWWTFIFDIAVALGLLIPMQFSHTLIAEAATCGQSANTRRGIATAIAITISALVAAMLGCYSDHESASAEGGLPMASDYFIFEPEEWVGKPLPVIDLIDIDLSNGEWIVLFHRHDCQYCQEMLPKYDQLASTGAKIALVEVPPFGRSASLHSACINGRLKDDRNWFVQTPVEIQLRDGWITAAKVYRK